MISSAIARPGRAPEQHRRRSRSPRSRLDHPGARPRPTSSPPFDACSHSSQNSRQRASASSSTSALPWASAPSTARCWPGRRSAAAITGSSPGVTVTTTSLRGRLVAPARRASRARPRAAAAASGRGSAQTPGPVAGGGQAARRPGAVDAAADQTRPMRAPSRRQRLGRDRGRGAGAQRGDRGAVDASRAARRSRRSETSSAPATTGSPRAGLCRKRRHPLERSPARRRAPASRGSRRPAGRRRRPSAGITQSPAAWRSNARRVRSIAAAGSTAASTASASNTGISLIGRGRLGP